ncbi:hypothetical protein HG530_013930 [Fusarium avenaceum]|nr:hypothetical protein HG530_013930 [Fusarium avenaceum]
MVRHSPQTLAGKVAVPEEQKAAEEVRASLNAEALVVEADLSTVDGPRLLIKATIKEFGRLDILINNAAICYPTQIDELSDDQLLKDWNRVLTLNGRGPLLLTRARVNAITRAIYDHLHRDKGHDGSVYEMLGEGAAPAIRLHAPKDFLDIILKQSESNPVASRLGTPEEVAAAVAMLCEEQADWINGAYIPVGGEMVMT